MDAVLFQIVIPFFLSALVVIVITYTAERYGTKLGGILGTLPSTLIVAFLFIAITKNIDFAAQSAAIVPAEIGINIILLFLVASLIQGYRYIGVLLSLIVWTVLTILLLLWNVTDIRASIIIYLAALIVTLLILEHKMKIPSQPYIKVHYTPARLLFRGAFAGLIIAVAVSLANMGAIFSGVFSVFPAIFLSTMLIFTHEHGPQFTQSIAKSMIFGSPSVTSYAIGIHFFYPVYGIVWGSILALMVSLTMTTLLLTLRKTIR
jgi:hypothetical protein